MDDSRTAQMTPTDLHALVEPLWKRCDSLVPTRVILGAKHELWFRGGWLWVPIAPIDSIGEDISAADALNAIIVTMVEWLARRAVAVFGGEVPYGAGTIGWYIYSPQEVLKIDGVADNAPIVAALVVACHAVLDQEEK